jgi:ArsR family transcriptional regulator
MNQESKITLMRERLLSAYEQRAEILKALAHPTRLIMIDTMQDEGDVCVGDLVELIGCDQSTISKHLAILKGAGLVEHKKRGQRMLYRVALPKTIELMDCVEEVIDEKLGLERR